MLKNVFLYFSFLPIPRNQYKQEPASQQVAKPIFDGPCKILIKSLFVESMKVRKHTREENFLTRL